VLGSIYKEMVKRGEKQSLISQGIKEESSGGIVYRREGSEFKFVLIMDAYGKWTFPKGHVDEGERPAQAAAREIREELGLVNLEEIDYLGDIQLKVHKPEQAAFRKLVHIYLFETTDTELHIPQVAELKDGKWFSADEAIEAIGYEETRAIFQQVVQRLNNPNEGQ
jgi:8-oxo-dGTP pyrophosphatase MutT (NUDIX family)